jgi:AP endonuclease 1
MSSFFRLQARRTLAPFRYQSLIKRAFFVMPVSRKTSKRKLEEDDEFEDGPSSQTTATQESQSQESQSQSSKAKKARTGGSTPEHINKVLPINISFPARIEGTVRIATWNICGWAASHKKVRQIIYVVFSNLSISKGFKRYVEAEDPDILVLSETKVRQAKKNLNTSSFSHEP